MPSITRWNKKRKGISRRRRIQYARVWFSRYQQIVIKSAFVTNCSCHRPTRSSGKLSFNKCDGSIIAKVFHFPAIFISYWAKTIKQMANNCYLYRRLILICARDSNTSIINRWQMVGSQDSTLYFYSIIKHWPWHQSVKPGSIYSLTDVSIFGDTAKTLCDNTKDYIKNNTIEQRVAGDIGKS